MTGRNEAGGCITLDNLVGSKGDARETKKESEVSKLQLLMVQTGTEQQLCVTIPLSF